MIREISLQVQKEKERNEKRTRCTELQLREVLGPLAVKSFFKGERQRHRGEEVRNC